jgi:two-component system phosphate regulon sensor histidine kinase PhoR
VVSVPLALPIVAVVSPATFTENTFQLGILLLVVATLTSVVVPRDRLFVPAYWVILLVDFSVIGSLYTGGRTSVTGLSLLCVFPVLWLAWSGAATRLAALLSFAGTLLDVGAPAISDEPGSVRDLASPLLIPFIMLAISATVAVMEKDTVAQHKRLRAAKVELQESRHSSALLSAVLDTVDVGVLALDRHGEIILMNNRQLINHELTLPVGTTSGVGETLEVFGLDRRTLEVFTSSSAPAPSGRQPFTEWAVA